MSGGLILPPGFAQLLADNSNHGAEFVYSVQWLFEEDNLPSPQEEIAPSLMAGMMIVMQLGQVGKTLVHLSITRRLK